MTPTEIIKALEAGLEGVTPGPWIRSGIQQKNLDQHGKYLAAGPDGALMFFSPLGRTGKDQATCIRDLDHVARCSPDNIRLLLDHIDVLEKALEAVGEFRWAGKVAGHEQSIIENLCAAIRDIQSIARAALQSKEPTNV